MTTTSFYFFCCCISWWHFQKLHSNHWACLWATVRISTKMQLQWYFMWRRPFTFRQSWFCLLFWWNQALRCTCSHLYVNQHTVDNSPSRTWLEYDFIKELLTTATTAQQFTCSVKPPHHSHWKIKNSSIKSYLSRTALLIQMCTTTLNYHIRQKDECVLYIIV